MNGKKHVFSLHEFRLIAGGNTNKLSNDDWIMEQKTLLISSGINKEFNNKRAKEIRLKCEVLGEQGWVISPFWRPYEDETWYDTWFWKIHDRLADKIADYFIEDSYLLLNQINAFSRFEVSRIDWFEEAEHLFEEGHYASCAMLLTGILEEGVRKCPIEQWRWRVEVFFNDAITTKLEDYYLRKLEPLNKYIDTILLLPSMNGFINSYFNSGISFGIGKDKNKKSEPSFLERNWLMHGMTKREITETDCVKLFNAICTLHYILQTIF